MGASSGLWQIPAVLVVDFVKAYTLKHAPLYAEGVAPAVLETSELLKVVRALGVPVIHTVVKYEPLSFLDGGVWIRKSPVLKCLVQPPFNEICEGVEPQPGELIVIKQYASAFFGTSLASTLTAAGIDTLIVTGCSTSGCIRATVVDGVQHGFRMIVPKECVGDRHADPHNANLFDINNKYGDVLTKAEVLTHLEARGIGG